MKSLVNNIKWTFIGNLVFAGAKWGVLILLTKNLEISLVGIFALGLAIVSPIFSFSNMQLKGIQATDANNRLRASDYMGFRFITIIISLISVAVITLVTQSNNVAIVAILLIGLWKSVESFSDVLYGYFQKHEEMLKIATSLILKGVLSLVVVAISVYYFKGLLSCVIALVLSWLFLLFFYDLKNYKLLLDRFEFTKNYYPTYEFSELKNLLKAGLPMGMVILFHNLNLNTPKYLINYNLGEAQLGIYSAISYVIVAGTTVVGAVGQSSMPRLAKHLINDVSLFKKLMLRMLVVASIVGILGVVISFFWGEFILSILYSDEYASYADIFVWTMISACFIYTASTIGCGLTAMNCYKKQAVIALFAMMITMLMSYLLIPELGLLGAPIAMTIGYFFQTIVSLFIMCLILKERENE